MVEHGKVILPEDVHSISIESEKILAEGFNASKLAQLGYVLIHHPRRLCAFNELHGETEVCDPDFDIFHPQKKPFFVLEVTKTPASKLLDNPGKQKQLRILKAQRQMNPDVYPFLFPLEILNNLDWGFTLLATIAEGRLDWDNGRKLIRKAIQQNNFDMNAITS